MDKALYGFSTEFFPLSNVPSVGVWMGIGVMRENVLSGCLSDGHDISPFEGDGNLIWHRAQLLGLYAVTRGRAECYVKIPGRRAGSWTKERGRGIQGGFGTPLSLQPWAPMFRPKIRVTRAHITLVRTPTTCKFPNLERTRTR